MFWPARSARSIGFRLLSEETGQDLVEYALLTAAIGLAGAAIFPLILSSIGVTYGNWGSNVNSLSLPPDPTGGGS